MERILAALASVASILSAVTGYLQYRASRETAHRPARTQAPAGAAGPLRSAKPDVPGTVRFLPTALVGEAILTTVMMFVFLVVVLGNLDDFNLDWDVPPPGAAPLIAGIGSLLIAAVIVPKAVRDGHRIRRGDQTARIRLIGTAVWDLLLAIALAVAALWLNNATDVTVPDPVFTVLTLLVVYAILIDLSFLYLLNNQNIRDWMEDRYDSR
jgi:hypothetical protein